MNCKPGDLAYIIGGEQIHNIGYPVEVLYLYSDSSPKGNGPQWMVRSKIELQSPGGVTFQGLAHDKWLRPFAGPSISHTIDVEIDLGVKA
jgi:hypothetical protein